MKPRIRNRKRHAYYVWNKLSQNTKIKLSAYKNGTYLLYDRNGKGVPMETKPRDWDASC